MNMDETPDAIARRCLSAAFDATMDFPTIVQTLIASGFEGYEIDYRRNTATYFTSGGDSLQLALPDTGGTVAPAFNARAIEQAVRDAQRNAPGYTYAGFCATVKAAGCAGYMVSFLGKRVVYFGRTAETHVEHFPK